MGWPECWTWCTLPREFGKLCYQGKSVHIFTQKKRYNYLPKKSVNLITIEIDTPNYLENSVHLITIEIGTFDYQVGTLDYRDISVHFVTNKNR